MMALKSKGSNNSAGIAVGEPSPNNNYLSSALEGHLITINSGKPEKIYHVENGRKRYISNPQVFESHGFNWGAVLFIPKSEVDALPDGGDISDIGSVPPQHPAMTDISVPPPIAKPSSPAPSVPPAISDTHRYTDLGFQAAGTILGLVAGAYEGPQAGSAVTGLFNSGQQALDSSGVLDD